MDIYGIFNIQCPEYFEYLKDKIRGPDSRIDNYEYLARVLYCKEFYYTIKEDENRVKWAQQYRERYLSDYDRTPNYIPNGPINCLELLISLAYEFDEVVYDYKYGHRQWFWFFIFIENLGLDIFNDSKFPFYTDDFVYIGERLDIWLNREYQPDGNGGNIIILNNTLKDLRTIDIWNQLTLFSSFVL